MYCFFFQKKMVIILVHNTLNLIKILTILYIFKTYEQFIKHVKIYIIYKILNKGSGTKDQYSLI